MVMAVLMLADCCEGAARAAAQHNRNLSQPELEVIVRTLIAERVDDGQLDESSLTFADLATITESFISTLVGVYHPRIAYPPKPETPQAVPATTISVDMPDTADQPLAPLEPTVEDVRPADAITADSREATSPLRLPFEG